MGLIICIHPSIDKINKKHRQWLLHNALALLFLFRLRILFWEFCGSDGPPVRSLPHWSHLSFVWNFLDFWLEKNVIFRVTGDYCNLFYLRYLTTFRIWSFFFMVMRLIMIEWRYAKFCITHGGRANVFYRFFF